MPDRPSAILPKPGRAVCGPVWPKPEMLSITRFGLTVCSTSQPSPSRSSTPGRKFSTSTSACSIRRRNSALPSACFRLRVTQFFSRALAPNHSGQPSLVGPILRSESPAPGVSIFTTSPPSSAIRLPAKGPAMTAPSSMTSSGLFGLSPDGGAARAFASSTRSRSASRHSGRSVAPDGVSIGSMPDRRGVTLRHRHRRRRSRYCRAPRSVRRPRCRRWCRSAPARHPVRRRFR